MVLANRAGKTVDGLRSLALVMLLLGAAALTACGGGGGGGGSGADAAGPGPGTDSGPAPTVPAQPFQVLFAGDNGKTGTELFRTDGTAAGTVLVKDINTNTVGAELMSLAAMGGLTYFAATNGLQGMELWKSNGTAEGTVLVKDINPGAQNSFPRALTVIASTLYFLADDGVNGDELWKSDGTAAGTVMVKDLVPGAVSGGTGQGNPYGFTAMGTTVYFYEQSNATGTKLWKSDGTTAGTVLVMPGTAFDRPTNLTVVGATLYFAATDAAHGQELWKTDGSAAGTVLVKDIEPGSNSSGPGVYGNSNSPDALVVVGNTLYFRAYDAINGTELWKSDGTDAGTVLVADINQIGLGSGPNTVRLDKIAFAMPMTGAQRGWLQTSWRAVD